MIVGGNKYILSDEDLMELSEGCPLTEGGTLEAFVDEAAVVAQAVQAAGVELQLLRPVSRALVMMRAFYFLGILRGGESYREEIEVIDELDGGTVRNEVLGSCDFSLVDWAAQDAAEELDAPEFEDRQRLVELLELEEEAW